MWHLYQTEECQTVVVPSPRMVEALMCYSQPHDLFREHLMAVSPQHIVKNLV